MNLIIKRSSLQSIPIKAQLNEKDYFLLLRDKKLQLQRTIKYLQKIKQSSRQDVHKNIDEIIHYKKVFDQRCVHMKYLIGRMEKKRETKVSSNIEEHLENYKTNQQIQFQDKQAYFRQLDQKILSFKLNYKLLGQQKQSLLLKLEAEEIRKYSSEQQVQELKKVVAINSLKVEELSQKLTNQKKKCEKYKRQLFQKFTDKKRLNICLQQLKGNIRVYCRIRPSKPNQPQIIYSIQDNLLFIKKDHQKGKSSNAQSQFSFVVDHIFQEKTTQIEVFNQISQLVQTSLDGRNVCIFAYGQTGSGKTFTMQGKAKYHQLAGVIPRSLSLIFDSIQRFRSNGTILQISISTYEIYNQTIINLLGKKGQKFTKPIFHSIQTLTQTQNLLQRAMSNRSIASTLCNSQSSRSHLFIVIKIKRQSNLKQDQESHLVLVDLAGSQRVNESGVTNQRMKEAQAINKSLSQLGKLIRSLKDNTYADFRSSKLTYFMHPYLQKGSKAVMFVNVSPALKDESQSINSLKFASTARSCDMGQKSA